MSDSSSAHCSQCGTSISDAPEGLCPRCLMAQIMRPTQVGEGDAMPPMTPEELAPHFPQLEIISCLGRGGMGVVYKARQKTLNRLVALKLLAPERVDDPQFATRFEKEAQALATLNHPHIVGVYDFGQAGGFYYLLMEFVDGVNLRQLLQTKHLTPKEALSIVPPVCDALQCAHDHGIVHRDIKPENLLIDKAGIVKIADFGIAKIIGDGTHEPQPLGTPDYAAPEQSAGASDHRTDIYSLGVVLYEMLTGERPKDKIEAPSKRVQVDIRIDEIVLRALEKTPELRFATAAEFRTQVEAAVGGAQSPERGALRAGAIVAAVWVGIVLVGLGVTFLVEVIRDGMRGEGPFLLVGFLLALAPLVRAFFHGGWLRAFSWSALIMTLPCMALGCFFIYAMIWEGGGWRPNPVEAFVVPLTWIGAVLLPLAGITLRRSSRPKGEKSGCMKWILLFLAVMFGTALLGAALLFISYRQLSQSKASEERALSKQMQFMTIADGFDLPVGAPDGKGYKISRGAGGSHQGEDWNGDGGGDSDFGDPVYAVADGLVVFSYNAKGAFGNVIIVRHLYTEKGGTPMVCESSYGHLLERMVKAGDMVRRGQKIGRLGNNDGMYPAHLHFEMRKTVGMGLEQSKYVKSSVNYWVPSAFIDERRPAIKP